MPSYRAVENLVSQPSTSLHDIQLSDDLLLQICRASLEDAPVTSNWMDDLRSVPGLVRQSGQPFHLELAITLLASVLGELPRHNSTHLPLGFGGSRLQPYHWIEQSTLASIGKQMAGLVWSHHEPDTIAMTVEHALTTAVRLGFLDRKCDDAWFSGIANGRGWRVAVIATPYGVTKARSVRGSEVPGSQVQERTSPEACKANGAPCQLTDANVATVRSGPDDKALVAPTRHHDRDGRLTAIDDRYAWARQIDLVNATNQVLGQDMLSRGVLSRACRLKSVQTNGKRGQATRVQVSSFLRWAGRHFSIATNEQIQIRNAIIGEINARHTRNF